MNRKSQKAFAFVSLGVIFILLGSSLVLASPPEQVPVVTPSPTIEPTKTPTPVGLEPMRGLDSPPKQDPGPVPSPTRDFPPEPEPTNTSEPEPSPTKKPVPGPTGTEEPQPSGGKRKRGPSGKPHANSSISGFVINHATGKGAPGMVVEIDASGWKDRTVTDDNGFYYFHGLSWGRAILNLVLEDGGLPTNPNAVASLTGHNEIRVDLGFFPPAPNPVGQLEAQEASASAPAGSGEASASSGLEASQKQGNVAASEPNTPTEALAPAENEAAPPTAEARLSGTVPEAEQPIQERMPVTGRAAGPDYDGHLLLSGVALGALVLLGRRVARSLRR
jgi:hypothetical protein